jgi:hypothetical protein
VQAAIVDDGDAGFLHLGDQGREVLVADVDAFIHDFRHAGGVGIAFLVSSARPWP